ncbi:MAG TPA: MarR family transcriptional regulator [Cellvibrionaceae bacterium]
MKSKKKESPFEYIASLEYDFFVAQNKLHEARAALAAHIADSGLTCEQWRVLREASNEAISITTLAEHSGILRPSVSRILNTLAANKLVTRTTDKSDVRRAFVQITAKGKKVLAKVGESA